MNAAGCVRFNNVTCPLECLYTFACAQVWSLWKIAWYLFFTNIKRFLPHESQTFWQYDIYTRIKTNCVLIAKIRIFRIFTNLVLTLSFDQVKLERWRLSAERYATCFNLLTYIYAIKFTFVQNPSDFFIFYWGNSCLYFCRYNPT